MSQTNFTFSTSSSAASGTGPFTIVFVTNDILASLTGNQFLSKVVYSFPDKTVTLTNDFTNNFANVTYTVPPSSGASTYTYVITVSAFIGPAFSTPTVYTLSATVLPTYFTTNPSIVSPKPHTFGEVHLLKTRAWGSNNTIMYLLESNNPSYLLVNYNG